MDASVFRLLSYGMYVVASFSPSTSLGGNRKLNGQIANTVFQVTSDPPQLAVCLNCQNLTHELVAESKRFSVSILSQEAPLKFIGLFGFKCGRSVDKYSGVNHQVLKSGTPVILDYSLGWLDLEVTQAIPLGTHTLFIGRITDSAVGAEGTPMTYDYYHQVKGGKTQANAPTYIVRT
jgi:ferric-chelate reductase [NAD(P)H]